MFRGENGQRGQFLPTTGIRRLSTAYYPGDIEGLACLALCEQPPRDCSGDDGAAPWQLGFRRDSAAGYGGRPKTVIISGNHRAARTVVIGRFAWRINWSYVFAWRHPSLPSQ